MLSIFKTQATQCPSLSALLHKIFPGHLLKQMVTPAKRFVQWLKRILSPHCCDQNLTLDSSEWVSWRKIQFPCCPLQNRKTALHLTESLSPLVSKEKQRSVSFQLEHLNKVMKRLCIHFKLICQPIPGISAIMLLHSMKPNGPLKPAV